MLITNGYIRTGNVSSREDPREATPRASDRRESKEDRATTTTARRTTRAARTAAQTG